VSRPPWLGASPEDPFPPVASALTQPNGLLAIGGDLSVPRLLSAYRAGIFPWYMPGEPLLWWSPDPRCVFGTHHMHVPKRLRRWLKASTWTVSADRDFAAVIDGCAAPRRDDGGTWISPEMRAAYLTLHELGTRTASRPGTGRVWSGACTGWRWAGCSSPNRCTAPRRTVRRSRC
jgi:leucyl/phenylalanyl-tRNA--protein transferase